MNKLKWIIFAGLVVLLTVLFYGPFSYVIHWHEQHTLFRFSDIYFSAFLSKPAGLLNYITAFVVQFFFIPLLGSILFAVILSAVFLLNTLIIKKITGKDDCFLFSLLPVIFLVVQYSFIEYPVSVVVGIVINQLVFYLLLLLPRQARNYLSYLLLIGLFYISGFHSAIFLLYLVFYSILSKKIIHAVVPIMLFIGLFFLSAYCYKVPLTSIADAGNNGQFLNILLFFLFILSFFLALFLTKYYPKKKKSQIIVTACIVGICILVAFYCINVRDNADTRTMLQMGDAANNSQWDAVIQLSKNIEGENQLVTYLTNLALFHTGKLSEDMFRYPQNFGRNSLYLPWKASIGLEYGDLVYAGLGYYNKAIRWASEPLTVNGETAPILKKLIKYYRNNSTPEIAQMFINILDESLFYSRMENASVAPGIQHDPTIPSLFSTDDDITNELWYLCERQPQNRMAFEYFMASLLLSNRVIDFADNIGRIRNFNYNKTPRSYEEALLIFQMVDPPKFRTLNIPISAETQNRFAHYSQLFQARDNSQLKRLFGDTYWYYIHFNSPYGNNIIAQ